MLCLPRLAQIVSLFSIPLVAAYPFMKRITWWPQIWLGLTFNWAFLVAESIKLDFLTYHFLDIVRGHFSILFFIGLVFWTIGYDTIYACQDTEDDAIIGIKSTARKFGKRVKLGVALCYFASLFFIFIAFYSKDIDFLNIRLDPEAVAFDKGLTFICSGPTYIAGLHAILFILPFALHLTWQIKRFKISDNENYLRIFKSNVTTAIILIATIITLYVLIPHLFEWGDHRLLWPWESTYV